MTVAHTRRTWNGAHTPRDIAAAVGEHLDREGGVLRGVTGLGFLDDPPRVEVHLLRGEPEFCCFTAGSGEHHRYIVEPAVADHVRDYRGAADVFAAEEDDSPVVPCWIDLPFRVVAKVIPQFSQVHHRPVGIHAAIVEFTEPCGVGVFPAPAVDLIVADQCSGGCIDRYRSVTFRAEEHAGRCPGLADQSPLFADRVRDTGGQGAYNSAGSVSNNPRRAVRARQVWTVHPSS